MNQENEQTKNDRYVMIDVGSSKFICLPIDTFIELSDDIVVMEADGWGENRQYSVVGGPTDFKLIDQEFITVAKARTRLLASQKEPK